MSQQTILERIIEQRKKDVEEAKKNISEDQIKQEIERNQSLNRYTLNNFYEKLKRNRKENKLSVLGEMKRASPSKGDISMDIIASEQGMKYALAGVTVISCLTEPTWFKGTLKDMNEIRNEIDSLGNENRPSLLRKDFLIDPYQIYEARANGADTILLIVAAMERDQISQQLNHLIQISRSLGMEPLVEVNNSEEMKIALQVGAKVIGINNRNLHDFQVDLSTTTRIVENLDANQQEDLILIALSGISNRRDVEYFESSGVKAVLVGEALMRSKNPRDKILELSGLKQETLVKICGIMEPSMAIQTANSGADFIGLVFAKSKRQVSLELANEIVSSIHSYRKTGQNIVQPPSPSSKENNLKEWGDSFAKALSKARPLIVGVFADNDLETIRSVCNSVPLDVIQLSGNEEYSLMDNLDLPCWKAVHVGPQHNERQIIESIPGGKQLASILLDTQDPNVRGGTGKTFDWSIVQQLGQSIPFFLAGGLTPENVSDAVQQCHPYGVDVSSGVETEGKKDAKKISSFIQQCKQ